MQLEPELLRQRHDRAYVIVNESFAAEAEGAGVSLRVARPPLGTVEGVAVLVVVGAKHLAGAGIVTDPYSVLAAVAHELANRVAIGVLRDPIKHAGKYLVILHAEVRHELDLTFHEVGIERQGGMVFVRVPDPAILRHGVPVVDAGAYEHGLFEALRGYRPWTYASIASTSPVSRPYRDSPLGLAAPTVSEWQA